MSFICKETFDTLTKSSIIVSSLSTISLTIVGLYLILNKKIRKHPYLLIGVTCLTEGLLFSSVMCYNLKKCEY